MKKVLIGILLFLVFIFIYFLEVDFFPLIPIAGIIPNLFIVFILFVGLFANSIFAIGFAVIGGLLIDSVNSPFIGGTAIMLTIIAFLASYFDRNFSKDSRIIGPVKRKQIVGKANLVIYPFKNKGHRKLDCLQGK